MFFVKDNILVYITSNIFIFNMYIEYFILQCIIIYIYSLLAVNNNMYYSLLYLFLITIYYGVVLSFCQVELFTGFLWTVEFVVIFVFLLLLFYVNAQGDFLPLSFNFSRYINLMVLFLFVLLYPSFTYYNFNLPDELNIYVLWEDYYESLYNNNMNDFVGLYISYYILNSFEFLLIGILLFFGSIICISLFRLNKVVKFKNYSKLLKTFNFSQIYSYNSFIRHQNIVMQANEKPAIRTFRGKSTFIAKTKKDGTKS